MSKFFVDTLGRMQHLQNWNIKKKRTAAGKTFVSGKIFSGIALFRLDPRDKHLASFYENCWSSKINPSYLNVKPNKNTWDYVLSDAF